MTRRLFLGLLALLLPAAVRASVGEVEATAFCPCFRCCGHNSPEVGGHGLTASGVKPREGVTVAADWSVYPKGSRLYIANVGTRVVQDKGSAIQGNRIDVFFRNHETARRFGRRRLMARLLGRGVR